ncbi:PAS domain-containing protein [Kroppenstedtia pulmonis]|uniref:histidine kinase n=1 Tax=Kroppenstedtia pulmonis TaxID=1380685 RepID=A0A7D4BDU8_9BACL|nr:ATP-binding protein [Kroppenstedtia pulmonis]QKG83052.1 PAS domain-containing protein [Kroppenstedtia pulmonis]
MPIAFHLDMELDQLRSWVERMPQAVMVADDRGDIVAVNGMMLRTLQCMKEEVLGQPYKTILSLPERVKDYLCHIDQYENPLQSVQGRLLIRHSPPKTVTIQVISGKSHDSWYHLMLVGPVLQKLSLLQQYAENLIADIHLGVLVMDDNDHVVEINKAACRLFGITRQEVLQKPLAELWTKIYQDSEECSLQEKIIQGKPFRNHATYWKVKGNGYHVLVDYQILKDRGKYDAGTYLILKDITQLHKLEKQIQRTDRLATIGQIAAGTAHEIRNPLTSIRGFLQVMKHAMKEKKELKEQGYAEIMLREIDRINDLVSEVLLLSKPRSVRMHPIQVERVLQELMPIIENEAILHNTEVRYRQEQAELPVVKADGEMLKQVFLNLSKNAIEAMGDGGILTIDLGLHRKERCVTVEVHDVGPGIPSHALEKIFDPFFTTKEHGTGLGLSVCQRIIEDIQGRIQVDTKELGTTFRVLIPCLES